MRSESEIAWVRVRNNVGQLTKVSDWHAIIPGFGSTVPPGLVCGTALSGSRQFTTHSGVKTLDGTKHDVCMSAAEEWVAGIDPSPGPYEPGQEPQILAPPDGSPEIK